MPSNVGPEDARRAKELRQPRRTRSGTRERPWQEIADMLRAEGRPKYAPQDLADAVSRLPLEEDAKHSRSPAEMSQLERGFREAWPEEFPGEPWPGLDEARRRIREKSGFKR